jgi:flagellar motor switch protein FliG
MRQEITKVGSGGGITGLEKATILLSFLGKDFSEKLMGMLSEEEGETLRKAMESVEFEEGRTEEVLAEFLSLSGDNGSGGVSGEFRSRADGRNVKGRANEDVSQFLENTDIHRLAGIVSDESPQTIAVILSKMSPECGAELLSLLPDDLQSETATRLAKMDEISPMVVEKVLSIIERRLRGTTEDKVEPHHGVRAVAELLKSLEKERSGHLIDRIGKGNPGLADSIKNSMILFEDIKALSNQALRELIQRIDRKILSTALKGASEDLKEKFFANMSQRAREMLVEEMDFMGPVRLKDVEDAQREIVEILKEMDEEGLIQITSGADDELVY